MLVTVLETNVKLLLCIILLLSIIGCNYQSVKYQSPEDKITPFINNVYHPAVALLYSSNNNPGGKDFRCTATAISHVPDGYLFLTAAHCTVRVENRLFLSPDTSDPEIYYPATVLSYGDLQLGYDFAILHIKAPKQAFTVVPIGHNPVRMGEEIFSINSTGGIGRSFISGVVSVLDLPHHLRVESNGFKTDWQHNILGQMVGEGPGSSGGSVICKDQMAICAIIVGRAGVAGQVFEPIEHFYTWREGVASGKIEPFPPLPPLPPQVDLYKELMKLLGPR